jgi:uncharacterized protein
MEKIEFLSPDGLTLAGFPAIRKKSAPTVILCHTRGTSHKLEIIQAIGDFLLESGLNVFFFDFRGHGESQAAPLSYGWYERFDIIGAVNYLSARNDLDPEKISGFGISMGGAALVLAAAECTNIRSVVIESVYPRFEDSAQCRVGERMLVPGSPEQEEYLNNIKAGLKIGGDIAPIDYIRKISPRPLLMIHGDADKDIPLDWAEKMFVVARPPKEFWTVKGGDHNNCYFTDQAGYNRKLLDFYGKYAG